eukprot:jgi/Phyca11/132495/e_gw1.173.8.1
MKFEGIENTQIQNLQLQRIGQDTYTVRVPLIPEGVAGHTLAKVERWALAILLSSPRIKVGERVGQPPPVSLRRPPRLRREFNWQVEGTKIIGWATSGEASIQLEQQEDGIHWAVTSHINARKDANKLHKRQGGVIFEAHPLLHGYPWKVKTSRTNTKVLWEIKRQAKLELRAMATPHLNKLSDKLTKRAATDVWNKGQQSQTPKQLGGHQNMLTDYQVWTAYRFATNQLNLYYPDRGIQMRCPHDPECKGEESSSSHSVWDCNRAQQFWRKWLEHWFGYELTRSQVSRYRDNFSSRTAPPISIQIRERLTQYCGRYNEDFDRTLRRIWWAVCSIA